MLVCLLSVISDFQIEMRHLNQPPEGDRGVRCLNLKPDIGGSPPASNFSFSYVGLNHTPRPRVERVAYAYEKEKTLGPISALKLY